MMNKKKTRVTDTHCDSNGSHNSSDDIVHSFLFLSKVCNTIELLFTKADGRTTTKIGTRAKYFLNSLDAADKDKLQAIM